MARWVRRRDRAGRVLAVANQKRGALELHGVSRQEADRAAWTIDREGHRLQGAAEPLAHEATVGAGDVGYRVRGREQVGDQEEALVPRQ